MTSSRLLPAAIRDLSPVGQRPWSRHVTRPGDQHWQAVKFDDAIATPPPRQVLCWIPSGSSAIPDQITNRKCAARPKAQQDVPKPKRWWQRWRKE